MNALGHVDDFQPMLQLAESIIKIAVLAVIDGFLKIDFFWPVICQVG